MTKRSVLANKVSGIASDGGRRGTFEVCRADRRTSLTTTLLEITFATSAPPSEATIAAWPRSSSAWGRPCSSH